MKKRAIFAAIASTIICLLTLYLLFGASDFDSIKLGMNRLEVRIRLGIPDYVDQDVQKNPLLYGGEKLLKEHHAPYAYRYDDASYSLFVCFDGKTNTVISLLTLIE